MIVAGIRGSTFRLPYFLALAAIKAEENELRKHSEQLLAKQTTVVTKPPKGVGTVRKSIKRVLASGYFAKVCSLKNVFQFDAPFFLGSFSDGQVEFLSLVIS